MKKLLVPPKYEIMMVQSNYPLFNYCKSYIGLFCIAPCKGMTLIFFASFLYFPYCSSKYALAIGVALSHS